MKRAALLFLLLSATCLTGGSPIARWTFDEAGEKGAAASVPAGFPGTMANASGKVQRQTERKRTFLRIPGTDAGDCVTLGEGKAFDLPQRFSLEAWFRPHASPPGSYTMILGKRYDQQCQLDWTPNGGGTIEFFVGGGHLTENRASANRIKPGNWLHIVASYDSQAEGPNQWLYLNGKLAKAIHNPVKLKPSSAALRIAQNSAMNMKSNVRADWDEVAVYDHALSAAEITALYEAKAERTWRPEGKTWSPPFEAARWQSRQGASGEDAQVDRMSGIKQTGGNSRAGEGRLAAAQDGVRFSLKGIPSTRVTGDWHTTFPEAVDLTKLPYCVIRYRARGAQRAMTPIPMLTLAGDEPHVLLTSSHAIQDGLWHLCAVKSGAIRRATGLEAGLATLGSEAELEVGSIHFAASTDAFPVYLGLTTDAVAGARTKEFTTVDLGKQYNDSLTERVDRLFSSDKPFLRNPLTRFPTATVAWHGVPFAVATRDANLVTPEARNANVNQEQVEVFGVSVKRASFLPESRNDPLTVAVNAKVSEVFMLLSCDFPAVRKRYSRPPIPVAFTDIEAFSVELHYENGDVDESFPYSMAAKGHRIWGLSGAYVVPADPAKQLQNIVLRNRTWDHTVSLAALTLRTAPDRLFPTLAAEPKWTVPPTVPTIMPRPATMVRDGNTITATTSHAQLVFDCSKGFRIAAIRPQWSDTSIALSPTSGLEIKQGDTTWNGTDLACTGLSVKGKNARIVLRCPPPDLPLELTLTITVRENGEIRFRVEALNPGLEVRKPAVRFPVIREATLGTVADTWVFFPQYRNVMTNQATFCKQPNHRGFPMQFMDIYNPVAGIGMCLMTQSLTGEAVQYCLAKDGTGANAYIESGGDDWPLSPGQSVTYCPRVLALHPGDWREGAAIYRRWAESWYRPVGSQDKAWFRKAVWIRSHLSSETGAKRIARMPPVVEPKSKRFRLAEYLEQDRLLLGLDPDILHFYVWAFDPEGTGDAARNGEYGGADYANMGGLANFAAAIAGLQEGRRMPVSLYTIWDRCSRSTPFVQEHGERFAKVRYTGQKLVNKDTVYMATSTPVWRDHAAKTLARLQADTKVRVLYLDVFGSDQRSRCFNPDAGHPMPSRVSAGDRDFLRAVRQAQPEGVALWGEFPTTDIASPYWDGFLSYDCIPLHSYLAEEYRVDDRAPLWSSQTLPPNVLRFIFPKLKQTVFPVGQEGYIESWRFLKFLLFNGQALFDTTWRLYDTDGRAKIGKSLRIMREYGDCFASDHPRMFVPTLRTHFYANEWPGPERTVWTLFNARYHTLRGKTIEVPHTPGATYRDLWNDRKLTPEIRGDRAILSLSIPPQGIVCVVQE
ncbi:MAG: LamG domain-containing protein [Victivallales bacterium]|nr:LamG domain-containing protein [Victivallales bacterium]